MGTINNDHALLLVVEVGGRCNCGELFEYPPDEAVEEWLHHIEIVTLMEKARELALQEREARLAGEETILRLLELGLSARAVSSVIGHDDDGKLMVSPTLVLRLERAEHVLTPRRRRRT